MQNVNTKQYLTPNLIRNVQQQASDVVWQLGILGKFTRKWYDVLTVSPLGLIHIEGNSDTGWKHISERHGYFSTESYFGQGSLGSPSKFTRSAVPIEDFRNIADDIYRTGEKYTKDHPDSNLFEKFKGKSHRYTGSNGKAIEFHLVLYRGTKIVHSLYPTKNIEGKLPKRILPDLTRAQKKIAAEVPISYEYFIVRIPYDTIQDITRYVIIFKIDTETQVTKGYIQVNALNGNPIFTTYPELCTFKVNTVLPPLSGDIPIEFIRFINTLGITDLSKLEQVINQIEKQLFSNMKVHSDD